MSDGSQARRRSVDVGGLALALGDEGLGHGWGGWEETEKGETKYAEVLIDVCAHTETIVNLDLIQTPPCLPLESHTRSRLIKSLSTWDFEPHKLPEEEVLACAYVLFEAVFCLEGMPETVGVPFCQITSFLHHLRHMYRRGNTYHNFVHAMDVLQATYSFLHLAGAVPPVSILLNPDARSWKPDKDANRHSLVSRLTNEDIFALVVAAVGHDVGHPGLTNAFMKNAQTPLAVVYDDKSVLEQMHYSLILQLMRHHGLGSLLDRPDSGQRFRKLLLMTVLATDLSIHDQFMSRFTALVDGKPIEELQQRILLCQAIIKCADISNPSRPYVVSQHWAAALESEWSSQLLLEKHLQLPASVSPADDSVSEARTQVFFSDRFARPLFELTTKGIPEMSPFARQCKENLRLWKDRVVAPSAQTNPGATSRATLHAQVPGDFLSAFPPTLPKSFLASEEDSQAQASDIASELFMRSRASSSVSDSVSSSFSHYETCESSPSSRPVSPYELEGSELPLPAYLEQRLEVSPTSLAPPFRRTPSLASTSSCYINRIDATAAIRAAYKASVRKKKSFHRSSWNPTPTEFSAMMSKISPAQAVSPTSPLASSLVASPMTPPSSSVGPPTPNSILPVVLNGLNGSLHKPSS